MNLAIWILISLYCFSTPSKQINKHTGAKKKYLNVDSIKRIINGLDEKVGHPSGIKKLIKNDSIIYFSAITSNSIYYTTITQGRTEDISGNSESGYVRRITTDGNPIVEITTYYSTRAIKNFQCQYYRSYIKYPIDVYEEFDITGNLVKKFDPAKMIHFTISDVEKLVHKRGGEKAIQATLIFSPDNRKIWYVRYFSKKDGLSDFVINAKNGKIMGQNTI